MFEGGPPEFAGRPHRGRRQRRPQMDDRPVRQDPTESGLPADSSSLTRPNGWTTCPYGLDALRVRGYRPMVMVSAPLTPVDCPLRSGPRSAKARGPPGSMAPRASAFTGMGESSWTPPLSGRSFSACRSWRSWRSSCSPCTRRQVFSRTGVTTPPRTRIPPADAATASGRTRPARSEPGRTPRSGRPTGAPWRSPGRSTCPTG